MKQQTFLDDLDRYKKWKLSQVRYDTEFGIVHAPAKDGSLDLKKIEEEESIARKIITKIMRERRNQRAPFNAQDAQLSFLDGLAKDDEVSDYQRRLTSGNLILSDGIISPRGGIDTSRTSKSKGGNGGATTDRNRLNE